MVVTSTKLLVYFISMLTMHTNLLSCVFFIIFRLQPQYNLDFLCIARFIIFVVLF